MTKSKKHAPQELTDEELMQVTGGATRYVSESNYNSMVQACSIWKDKEGCANNTNCYWYKDSCEVSYFIQPDPKLKGYEEYKAS